MVSCVFAGLGFVSSQFVFSFSLGAGMVPWFPLFDGLGFVSVQFVFSFPLGAGIVSLGAGIVPLGAGIVSLGAGIVPLDEGTVVVLLVQLVEGVVSLVAGMVVLLVLQGKRYTGIVNMISRHLWVWFVEVVLEEVLLTPGLEEFCIVLLEDVTLALLQLVPLMVSLVDPSGAGTVLVVSLVDPSGAGTVLFQETVVVFTTVVFSEIVVFTNVVFSEVVVVLEQAVVLEEDDTFEEDTFEEDTFEEDSFEEDTLGQGTSELDVVLEEDDTFEEDASVHVSFTMRAREGWHNVASYSVPIKALR